MAATYLVRIDYATGPPVDVPCDDMDVAKAAIKAIIDKINTFNRNMPTVAIGDYAVVNLIDMRAATIHRIVGAA